MVCGVRLEQQVRVLSRGAAAASALALALVAAAAVSH